MNISVFQKKLIEYLDETGLSQNELSKETGVPQSQISNWVSGNGKRVSKNAIKIMRHIENYRKSEEAPIPNNVATAIRNFCGSSREKSEILAQIIQTLQPLAD
ncbi:helix-turn-helix domain-containing protein [Kiloniella majae]|uniref:helix-turn-helix domain-containing protein n=1 Tax=Kiloniella majae TaxID=1938558 RepID=UPI000A278CFF|nr:helix-turn-helix transcriptional regulator [Kiloniella majae]